MTDEHLNNLYPGCLIKTKGYMKKNESVRVYLSEIKKNPSCIIFKNEEGYIIIPKELLTESSLRNIEYNVMGEYYTFYKKDYNVFIPKTELSIETKLFSKIPDSKSKLSNEKIIEISKILTELNIEHKLKIEINGY